MKNLLQLCTLVLALTSVVTVFAQDHDYNYRLKDLDVMKTCKLGTIQEVNAEMTISHLKSFIWWNLKDQYNSFHPELKHWHASLSAAVAANPLADLVVPFKKGIVTKANFVKTFAFIAFANDITGYTLVPTRLDCVGDDTVILVHHFKVPTVKRDGNGCITHVAHYAGLGREQFEFKDNMIYRMYSHFDENLTAKGKLDLDKIAQGPSNVQPNPAKCKTLKQIENEFQDQIDN